MASTILSRTPGSVGNRRKWTFATWVKLAGLNTSRTLFGSPSTGSDYNQIWLSGDVFRFDQYTGGSPVASLITNRVFKDPAAWYHIVCIWDSDNAVAGDRMKMYINGVEEGSVGGYSTDTNPALNLDSYVNSTSYPMEIGGMNAGEYLSGALAHTHFCDGQAYAASEFGEFDSASGIWKPKTGPSVTYGTNGFFLKYASGASGADSSGNGNTFSVSGNLTNLKDTPSNNMATLNTNNQTQSAVVYTNGNTTVTNADQWRGMTSTLGMISGKWYLEFKLTGTNAQNGVMFGVGKEGETTSTYRMESANNGYTGKYAYGYDRYASSTSKNNNNTPVSGYGQIMAENDIGMVAFDATNGTIWTGVNGTWDNSATSSEIAAGTTTNAMYSGITMDGAFFFSWSIEGTSVTPYVNCNFGNGYFGTTAISSAGSVSTGDDSLFEYDVPTGFYGLNTKNLGSYS